MRARDMAACRRRSCLFSLKGQQPLRHFKGECTVLERVLTPFDLPRTEPCSKRSKPEEDGHMGHSVARVQRVLRVLPAFGRRLQRVVVAPCGRNIIIYSNGA